MNRYISAVELSERHELNLPENPHPPASLAFAHQDGLSSEGFAHLAAAVFISRGFRVFLMGGTVATPLVAFGVSHTKACAGVMVTASHNPKKDNGYKVYWGNGSQIIPPHDKGIAASIQRNLEPWQVGVGAASCSISRKPSLREPHSSKYV